MHKYNLEMETRFFKEILCRLQPTMVKNTIEIYLCELYNIDPCTIPKYIKQVANDWMKIISSRE